MSAKAILSASVSAPPAVYVEDVFSTFLYTGNGTTQTITNGIDLSGKGGLVWVKHRDQTVDHVFYDTQRGATKSLSSNTSGSEITSSDTLTSFNSSGFSLGADSFNNFVNNAGFGAGNNDYASWTFRKQPKFFDIVTWTGDSTIRAIPHNLGSAPGCIIVKRLNAANSWVVYHRATSATPREDVGFLNSNSAWYIGFDQGDPFWGNTAPTSTNFTVNTALNNSGDTYVAYLFAHDAGGFGDAGTDNVVSCGSYTGNGSATGPIVNLGWEPQWLMIKRTDAAYDWWLSDNMRGMTVGGDDRPLLPNTTDQEQSFDWMSPTATGFQLTTSNINFNASGGTYIYIAIRRGPMKVPTVGTQVFNAIARTGTGAAATVTGVGFSPDWMLVKDRTTTNAQQSHTRIIGKNREMYPSATNAEASASLVELLMDGVNFGDGSGYYNYTRTYINHFFRRAPGFFDVVAYTGGASAISVSHNLGVQPEFVICKKRNASQFWVAGITALINGDYAVNFNSANSFVDLGAGFLGNDSTKLAPTSSTLYFGSAASCNGSGGTFIAYLFATLAGVSKVGSYTGTGTTKQIDCGFTAGARFVLIKRTDSTGDWYVWDTARGIISGNDPFLLLNSTAAEDTSTDYIDPLSSGFEISSSAPAAINANGGSFIFFAVA